MNETEEVSGLIGEIYDASLDPSLWPTVLGKIRTFVSGAGATIYAKDATTKTGGVFYDDGGISPHYTNLYFEKYIKLDPSTTVQFFGEPGTALSTNDLIPYEEFLETRFYKEWAQPQGLVDFLNAVLDRSTTSAMMFGVFRHERDGIVDDAMRARMGLLVPHVQRAMLISRAMERKAAEAATFADILDGLSAGMFLVDADGRIVHANAAAHAMVAEGDFLAAAGGRIVAKDPQADLALRAVFAASSHGDAAVGTRGISVPLGVTRNERRIAHVLPLTSGSRRQTGRSHKAAAALFVHSAAFEAPSPPEVISKAYRLTPTELRVLLAVVEVGGVPEVAEALGIAETTVKTHLGRVYAKTGAGRHADLVKLLAGFSSPLHHH